MQDNYTEAKIPLKQTSYRAQYERVQTDMPPLLPVDADIARNAQHLEDNAKEQQNRRYIEVTDEVER